MLVHAHIEGAVVSVHNTRNTQKLKTLLPCKYMLQRMCTTCKITAMECKVAYNLNKLTDRPKEAWTGAITTLHGQCYLNHRLLPMHKFLCNIVVHECYNSTAHPPHNQYWVHRHTTEVAAINFWCPHEGGTERVRGEWTHVNMRMGLCLHSTACAPSIK